MHLVATACAPIGANPSLEQKAPSHTETTLPVSSPRTKAPHVIWPNGTTQLTPTKSKRTTVGSARLMTGDSPSSCLLKAQTAFCIPHMCIPNIARKSAHRSHPAPIFGWASHP